MKQSLNLVRITWGEFKFCCMHFRKESQFIDFFVISVEDYLKSLLRASVISSKNIFRFSAKGGLCKLKQIHFMFEIFYLEQIVSLIFVSYFYSFTNKTLPKKIYQSSSMIIPIPPCSYFAPFNVKLSIWETLVYLTFTN